MKAVFKQIDGEKRLTGILADNSSIESKDSTIYETSESEIKNFFESNGLSYPEDLDGTENLKVILSNNELSFDDSYSPTGGS